MCFGEGVLVSKEAAILFLVGADPVNHDEDRGEFGFLFEKNIL